MGTSYIAVPSVEQLRKQYQPYAIPEDYDYYSILSDKERSYCKASIAFLCEHYCTQYTRVQSYTIQYTQHAVHYAKYPTTHLVAVLPHTISIPPLLALLLPAQILTIPTFVCFNTLPSPHILTALELAGIEDIFIHDQNTMVDNAKQHENSSIITYGDISDTKRLWHYTPPKLCTEKTPLFAWLYEDAIYSPTGASISENTASIWVYPELTLDAYYSYTYTVQEQR